MRLAAVQLWPWRVKRIDVIAPATVFSKSQSAKTIIGLFPPSSIVAGTMFSEAYWRIRRPGKANWIDQPNDCLLMTWIRISDRPRRARR